MLKNFAHSDDLHTQSTNELVHIITEWYVALPLYASLLLLLVYLLKGRLKTPTLINVVLGILFITGILSFQLIPVLSIITISIGILGALVIVLASLAH